MAIIASSVNGLLCHSISLKDRGLNYGDGVFETIAVVGNELIFWTEHFNRLVTSCSVLEILIPQESVLKKYISQLLDSQTGRVPYVIKIVLTRGESERGYAYAKDIEATIIVILSNYPRYLPEYWVKGVRVMLCQTRLSNQSQLAGIKHLNRLEQVLARREWDDEYQEGIMLDNNGYLIEGVMSNLFIVKNNVIYTPSLNNAGVDGIMRGIVLKLCETKGIIAKVENISLDILQSADEVFMTNSLIGIWPVRTIADTDFSVGDNTKHLMQLLLENYSVDYASFSL